MKLSKFFKVLIILLMGASISFAQSNVGQPAKGKLPNGNFEFIQLDSSGNLKTTGGSTGSTTLDTVQLERAVASTTAMVQTEGNQTQSAVASVTIAINSTPTVKIYPLRIASQSVILLTDTEFVITLATNSKYINFTSTGTFAFNTASTTVDSNTTPVYNATIETFGGMILSVKRIATDTYLTIREWGN